MCHRFTLFDVVITVLLGCGVLAVQELMRWVTPPVTSTLSVAEAPEFVPKPEMAVDAGPVAPSVDPAPLEFRTVEVTVRVVFKEPRARDFIQDQIGVLQSTIGVHPEIQKVTIQGLVGVTDGEDCRRYEILKE